MSSTKTLIINEKVHKKLRQIKFFKDQQTFSDAIQLLIDSYETKQKYPYVTNLSQFTTQW